MKPLFDKAFRVLTDDQRYFVIAEVDEKTARRAATLLADEPPEDLARILADALNLHAMPKLIAKARL